MTDRRHRPFVTVASRVASVAPSATPRLQKWLIRGGYQVLNRRRAAVGAACLNFGYAPPADAAWAARTELSGVPDRYGLQLYDRVAGAVELANADVLEVGCGRGGGAAYVARTFDTRALTGVDFSAEAIRWCRRMHRRPGLSFRTADAEALPFGDATFDAVLNVESSHCYPDIGQFLDEVGRVLRPGGAFLMADLRPADRIDELRAELADRFGLEEDEDITAEVVRALELDAPRRQRAIEADVPPFLRPIVGDFFALPGSEVFDDLAGGRLCYRRFVLRAPIP